MDQIDLSLGDTATDNLYPALFQCFTIILCGYVAGRLNVVSSTESKGIATFVGTFALPSLIFLSLAKLDFSTVNWMFLFAILLAKGLVFFSVMIVTILVSKPVNLGRAGMFAIFCTQSNDFALGYPIINALYEKTHPEYALYLYLMAPISLSILNPVAFILMEIHKQRETHAVSAREQFNLCTTKLLKQIVKGVLYNPVLMMTILGIIGNAAFKHELSIYIEGLLQVFGQSFSATALFLLGLRMVGQFHRLKGPALLLPCVLIMVKLIVLPVVMRESVSSLHAGVNESETTSLSTYAFLYGTIPTAPAVFVFSNIYQLEIDLVASSMVICTFLSAPMMYISAQLISINKDFAAQLKRLGFDLSIVSLVVSLWVLTVFVVTKKYKRMPHRLTLCLIVSQVILAVGGVWGGPVRNSAVSWLATAQQALTTFGIFSCMLWTSMLTVGILMLESRGPCFVVTLWPVLAFVAWGAPAVMVAVLLATKDAGDLSDKCIDAIRLCLLVFCLTVTTGCLIVYIRFRRRSARSPDETTRLVDDASTTPLTRSHSNHVTYRTITATPSPSRSANGCCSGDPNCDNGPISPEDIEDIAGKECQCPASSERCEAGACPCVPREHGRARGHQLLKHTVLVIVYSLAMFIGITYTMWRMMSKDESGVFVEIQFVDVAATYGQALVVAALFGLDPAEIVMPALRYIRSKWHGEDCVVLPAVEDLSFETRLVCDQFITHHLERCKQAIAKDTRVRMRTYRGVFRGACLVRWLVQTGLAGDERAAALYGRHLVDGRVIAHVHRAHHFTDSPLLYTFNTN